MMSSSPPKKPLGKKAKSSTSPSPSSSTTNHPTANILDSLMDTSVTSTSGVLQIIPPRTASLSREQMRQAYNNNNNNSNNENNTYNNINGLVGSPRRVNNGAGGGAPQSPGNPIDFNAFFPPPPPPARNNEVDERNNNVGGGTPSPTRQQQLQPLFQTDTSSLQSLLENLVQGYNAQTSQLRQLTNDFVDLKYDVNKNKVDGSNSVQTLSSKQDQNFQYLRTILGDDMDENGNRQIQSSSASPNTNNNNNSSSPPAPVSPAKRRQSVAPNAAAATAGDPSTFVPYQNLPHVFRSSFDFIRKEFKQQIEKHSEKLSKQIEDSISKATQEILMSADKKDKQTGDQARELLEQKTTAITKNMNEKMSELAQSIARGFEKSEDAEATLRNNLQSVTTLAQRIDKRFSERMDLGDDRAQSMENAFSKHVVEFSDLSHRIMPLIGGVEMDEAISSGEYMTKSGHYPPASSHHHHHHHHNHHDETISTNHHHNNNNNSQVGRTSMRKVPSSTILDHENSSDETRPQENPTSSSMEPSSSSTSMRHNSSLNRISPRRKSVAPVMFSEDEFEKTFESIPLPSSSSFTPPQRNLVSNSNNNNNQTPSGQQNQQQPIASSLVGSIDVEVLASHDARAIAMLHTAPFVALRHQILQDTKMRVTSARDSIMSELDNYLQELRDDIARRPQPQRVAEMIRDMTSDRQVPEQLAEIRQHLQSLDTGKIGHKLFNEALKQKSDVTHTQSKAEKEEVNAQLQNVNTKLEFLKEDLSSVQTERSQFRNMLREVLYMHRRAQTLSSGVSHSSETNHNSHTMRFLNSGGDDGSGSYDHEEHGSDRRQRVDGIHEHSKELEKSLRVRDPKLPSVQQRDPYEIHDDDPRMAIPNSGHIDKRTVYHPPPTAPTASSSSSSPRQHTNRVNNNNPTLQKRNSVAQKMVDDILVSPTKQSGSSSSTARQNSMRNLNSSRGRQEQQQQPNLTEVGSRDMKQQYQRKVYTPTDERADPPMD